MQKKLTILLCLSFLAFMSLSAQVVESFNYPSGTTLAGSGSAGNGWAGPWKKTTNSPDVTIDTGGVASVGIPYASSGNRLSISHAGGAANKRYFRGLTGTYPDTANGVYYLSFFIDNDWPPMTNDVRVSYIMFVDSMTLGDGGPGGQLAQFGRIFNNSNLGFGNGGNIRAADGAHSDQGHWVVVAVYMSGDASNEDFFFFVDPDPYAPLDTAVANIKFSGLNLNNGFNSLGFKVEGTGPLDTEIDEIRLGTSYADVIPGDLVKIVGPARESFNSYATGPGIQGLGGLTGGWGGPWNVETGDPNIHIVDSTITNFSILKATTGNSILCDYDTAGSPLIRLERPLNDTFADDGSTYYISYSTQAQVGANNTLSFLMLVDTARFAPTGGAGQLVQIGKPVNTPFLGAGIGATSNFSLTAADASDPHFVVIKVKTSGDSQPDTVELFIDPDLTAEPSTPDAVKIIGTNLNNGFNGIGIKVDGLGPGIIAQFDDIYVGLDYASVIPQDLTDVMNPVAALAFDNFAYAPGNALDGQGQARDGWSGPWEGYTAPDSSEIATGGILNNNLLVLTSTNKARLTSVGGSNRFRRFFDTPIDTANFWFSTHLAIDGSFGGNVGNFILMDSTLAGNANQKVWIGKQFGSRNIVAGGFGTGDVQSGEQFEAGIGNWIVGRMYYDTTNAQWSLYMWVDPNPAMAPDSANAQIKNKRYAGGQFHGAIVKADGTAGVHFDVDDIYFGRQFSEVVPVDLTAVPPVPNGAVETFNSYTAADSLIGLNGGSGWGGPWSLVGGSNQVIDGAGLSNFFLLKETSGNSLKFDGTTARIVRKLSDSYGDFGRSFWLGWFFETKNSGNNVAHLVLADTATYAPGGPGGQLAQIGKLFGGDAFGLVASPGGTAPGISTDTAHFIVAEIVTNGSPANDDIYLWIDPDLSGTPSRDTANVVGAADLSNWNAIGFKVEGTAGVIPRFDDIYLGNSFGEIVPPDLTDLDPPIIPVVAKEPFDYTAGNDLDGENGGEGFGGPWAQLNGSATISAGSINSNRVNPIGNKVEIDQSMDTISYERPFFNPFGLEKTVVWTSFLLDVDSKNIGNQGQVSFTSNGQPVLSIGGVPGLGNIGVIYNNGNSSTSSTSQSVLGVTWVVARIEMDGTSADDTVYIWTNPAPDALPDVANALFTLTDIDLNDGFDALRISARGVGSMRYFADEFAIGFSFRDISSKFGSDDPNLFAYEPFNYDAGTSLIGQGGINAFWDGVWVDNGNFSSNQADIIAGNLELPGFNPIGNKTEFQYLADATQIRIDRDLAFDMESDGTTYWLTFFVNTTDGAMLNNVGNVTLRNSNIANRDGQRLAFGRMFGSGKLGLIAPPANQPQLTTIDDLGLNWIVVKIQTNADPVVRDSIYMWVNPSPNNEPDTATADVFYRTDVLKQGIDQVRLKAEGINGMETPYVTEFDELRIATAWPSASTTTNVIDPIGSDIFQLAAYPNPFADQLNINFEVPSAERLRITVHDSRGRQIQVLADDTFAPGTHNLSWKVGSRDQGLANGFYYLRIVQDGQLSVRKLILYR